MGGFLPRAARAAPRGLVLSCAVGMALSAGMLAASSPASAQAVELRQYALASQSLGDALNLLAETGGVQILVPPRLVSGRSAPALSGRYTVDQALDRLLSGSGLVHRRTRGGVIIIRRAGRRADRAAEASATTAPPAAIPMRGPPMHSEFVQVVGSRIKRARMEGPSPITILSAEQIENEGHATVFEALDTLAMANGSVETELSGGFSANAYELNLRGLGPGRSLLLIDGRRAPDYPFPYQGRSNFQGFGNISSAAVERIEVLAGGASAIYGADALSGVVNVVLKHGYHGDALKVRGGTSTMGGRDRLDVQWTGGRSGDRWGLTYAFQHDRQELLYGFQRDFWDLRATPTPDSRLGRDGVQPSTALRIARGSGSIAATSGAAPLIAPPSGTCDKWEGEFFAYEFKRVSSSGVTPRGLACATWNNVGYRYLSKGKEDDAAHVAATWDATPGVQAWISMQAWRSKAESLGGFETITGPHTDGVGRRSDFFDPQFGEIIATYRVVTPMEVGGVEAMNQHYREQSLDLAAGVRGRMSDRFDWDLSLSRADYRFTRDRRRLVGDKVNAFFFGPELGMSAGTPIHRLNLEHWYRPMTPDEYASLSTIAHYEAKSWVDAASFTVTGDLFHLPAGTVSMAALLEASGQGYRLDSDPRVQPAVMELYSLTGTNGGGERDRYAAALELGIPVSATLKASLAGRFDTYDDITAVNAAKTWNAGLEWRPDKRLLLRGAYATSFKAPDMHWVFSEGSGSFGESRDRWRCIAAHANPTCSGYSYYMLTLTQGDHGLEEETGASWSAGVVWDPVDGLSVNADYWNIELNGAIQRLSTSQILDAEGGCHTGEYLSGAPFPFAPDSAYCRQVTALVTRRPEEGEAIGRVVQVKSAPVNQSYRRVAGIDAGLRWQLKTGRLGQYSASIDWSHTLASERQVLASDPVDKDWRDDPGNLDFRSRVRMGLNWRMGGWSANLFGIRYGSLPKANGSGRLGALSVWNANVGKHLGDRVTVRLYVNNLFNSLHPRDDSNSGFPYFYDVYSPVGREVAGQVEYRFR